VAEIGSGGFFLRAFGHAPLRKSLWVFVSSSERAFKETVARALSSFHNLALSKRSRAFYTDEREERFFALIFQEDSMTKFTSLKTLAVAVLVLMSAQGCRVGVVYGGGRWHHDHHYHGSRGGWHGHHRFAVDNLSNEEWNPESLNQAALELARDYGIRVESARKILYVTTADDVKAALAQTGLSADEFAPLRKLQMPSQESILHMASVLNESSTNIEDLLRGYVHDMRVE
jgi:hypothetical protein